MRFSRLLAQFLHFVAIVENLPLLKVFKKKKASPV